MHLEDKVDLLARVARVSAPSVGENAPATVSILALAAASFGALPSEDATCPTGFDIGAAALFEAIVEAAYLVATADGVFDEAERGAFERVLVAACGGVVAPKQVAALLSDYGDQLEEDGLDRRIEAVAKNVKKKEHGDEVLRIAGLIAATSDDVSVTERNVLDRLATALGLGPANVDAAMEAVRKALASA